MGADLLSFPQPSYDSATGSWDLRLDLSGSGGGVPEPSLGSLLASVGLALAVMGRFRGRS